MSKTKWQQLRRQVVACDRCPRLIRHCQEVAVTKRRSYRDQNYWGKPVPNFGQPKVSLLIVGLAPGAHGANRTGRMFTGDRSGDWLYRAMHRAGFANQAESKHRRDGLRLIDATITNIGRCAPPDNKPLAEELANCQPFFLRTLELTAPTVVLALGGLAWRQVIKSIVAQQDIEKPKRLPVFQHGGQFDIGQGRTLFGSYHPSQQNTFTGRLTESMLDEVFQAIGAVISTPAK